MFGWLNKIIAYLLSVPVHFYRYVISPHLRPSCRHIPTCSAYMLDALKLHGSLKGFLLGTNRILRCRPGGTHGYDPVPLFMFKKYRPIKLLFIRKKSCSRLK
ncbi:MAG: membrane protein insertion efficiency factor YidD [Bacteroidales bacterium]